MTALRLPPWSASATPHAVACWLFDSKIVRTYALARRELGRVERKRKNIKPTVSVEQYQSTLEKRGLS